MFPTVRNHVPLKSGIDPPVSQKEKGYSLRLEFTKRRRKAEFENEMMNVCIVVFDSRTVSVSKPIQSTSMMQIIRRT